MITWLVIILFLVCCTLSVIPTALSLLKRDEWYIRIWDFPRVQILVLAIVGALLFIYIFDSGNLWHITLMVLLLMTIIHHTVAMFPYTPLAKNQVKKMEEVTGQKVKPDISLLVSNVLMTNKDSGKLINLIEEYQPDVVLTLETNEWWQEKLAPIEQTYPHTVKVPQDNYYGMHLYSRLELIDPKVQNYVRDDIPSIKTRIQLHSGKVVWLFCIHPEPPFPNENPSTTERDAELLVVGKEIKENDLTAIVAGDLNDVAWSHTTRAFQRISQMLDPRKGRGFFNTFHAEYRLMRWPLDHVFLTKEFALDEMDRGPYIGSDHFPIFISIKHYPPANDKEDVPKADEKDLEEADEKINKAREEQKKT